MPRITLDALDAIEAHAVAAFPEECCGVLVGRKEGGEMVIVEAMPAQNLARSNRATRYFLDPRAILRAEEFARGAGMEVLGFYHSHPGEAAVPSATDRELAWEEYLYLIVPVTQGGVKEARVWRFVGGVAEEVELTIATE